MFVYFVSLLHKLHTYYNYYFALIANIIVPVYWPAEADTTSSTEIVNVPVRISLVRTNHECLVITEFMIVPANKIRRILRFCYNVIWKNFHDLKLSCKLSWLDSKKILDDKSFRYFWYFCSLFRFQRSEWEKILKGKMINKFDYRCSKCVVKIIM